MSRILTRLALGLEPDPWSRVHLRTADQVRVEQLVRAVIRTRDRAGRRTPPALIQVVGERGAGKTSAVTEALRQAAPRGRDGQAEPLHLVNVQRLHKERLTIGDIELAILTDLPRPASERISTRGEIRSRQLARAMGQADRTGPVVVVLEEGHRLHWSTVAALKSLRELRHGADAALCGVILIGQTDALASRAEIARRSDTVEMAGLLPSEIERAIAEALGDRCEPDARAVFAQAAPCRNWLDLIDRTDQALHLAHAAGRQAIARTDAVRVTSAGLSELAKEAGVTQPEIARHLSEVTGRRISESQVSRIMSGERPDTAVQSRITDFLLSRSGQGGGDAKAAGGAA